MKYYLIIGACVRCMTKEVGNCNYENWNKKVLAVLVTVIIIIGWAIAINDELVPLRALTNSSNTGLDINGVYVLLQADTKATGSDLNLWIRLNQYLKNQG